jgi:hypothetical protein
VVTFHIWITIKLPVDDGELVRSLVSKGYDVSPAAASNEFVLFPTDSASYAIMGCRVARTSLTQQELFDDTTYILGKIQAEYYSLVVSEASVASLWGTGRIINDKFVSFQDTKSTKITN